MIVLGEVLLTRSTALAMYWVVWFISANLFVMGYEEPTLRHEFGAEYDSTAGRSGDGFPGCRLSFKVQRFKGSKVQGFKGSGSEVHDRSRH